MNMNLTCNVTNKSAGVVGYTIPDSNIRRTFAARETKRNITVAELEQLYQQPGGPQLIYGYLLIDNPAVVDYLFNGSLSPEYWLKEEDIPKFITTCSLAEFQDLLDFAPDGTKEIIKKLAVSMPLTDMSKCAAIKEQLGFDVMKALELLKEDDKKATTSAKSAAPTGRRTTSSIEVPTVEEKPRVVVTTSSKETEKKEE